MPKEKRFNPQLYTDRYYKRHFNKYRLWEIAIGKHIVNRFAPKSMLDLGCGVGSFLEGAFMAGCKDLVGIEISFDKARKYFTKVVEPYIRYGDATCNLNLNRTFDCCLSFEVAEHIPPGRSHHFVNNLTQHSNGYIVFTAAPPHQHGGTGHINCREKKFWIDLFEDMGFRFQEDIVDEIRPIWKNFGAPGYILRNLMIFQKLKV